VHRVEGAECGGDGQGQLVAVPVFCGFSQAVFVTARLSVPGVPAVDVPEYNEAGRVPRNNYK